MGGGDEPGRDYDYAGRVDLRAIRDAAILPGADYYLCGPRFMRAQREALLALAWAPTAFTPKPSAAARRPERGVSWRSGLRRAAVLSFQPPCN